MFDLPTLTAYIKKKKIRYRWLSDEMGYHYSYINKVMNNIARPSPEFMEKLERCVKRWALQHWMDLHGQDYCSGKTNPPSKSKKRK